MIVDGKRDTPMLGPKKIIPTLRDAYPDLGLLDGHAMRIINPTVRVLPVYPG